MNISMFYLVLLGIFSSAMGQSIVDTQNPIVQRLDFVEANLQKLEADDRALFAQNQVLNEKFNARQVVTETKTVTIQDVLYLSSLAGLMAILVLAMCMERQKPVVHEKPRQKVSQSKPSAAQEEYDFMGSEEAVPAKFNLAEAYMQMREFSQAKRVLEEILKKGSPSQRQKASALLGQMPSV